MLFSYLVSEVFRRPLVFLKRWYVDASKRFWARVIEESASIDRIFAIKIMFRTLTQPLYGDYTIIGRIIGPIFRLSRIVLALPVFAAYFSAALTIWIIWITLPLYLVASALGLVKFP
jgi:hypothetical protein